MTYVCTREGSGRRKRFNTERQRNGETNGVDGCSVRQTRCRTLLSAPPFLCVIPFPQYFSVIYDNPPTFDDGSDRISADPDQVDRRPVHDHRVHLLAGLEAADSILAIERAGGVDGGADQRLLEGQVHAEAGER